jgi:hypothetical protein
VTETAERMHALWQRVREPVIVLIITIAVALVSQRWAGLDTPDSSFYASLGLWGSEITDRAPIDSYYWTRLGYIAPVSALTSLLGTWAGFEAYRVLLLLVLVTSTYVILRRFTAIASAAFLTGILTLSTVVLSYLGNSYLTGSVLAGTAAVIATALFRGKRAAILAGALLGWLVMVNPPGALLAGTLWVAVRIHGRIRVAEVLATAVSTIVVFFGFWAVGLAMFPGLSWFGAYVDSDARTRLSDFASKELVWLDDISLIVPVAILITVAIVWITHRRERPAQVALIISLTSVAFMLVFNPLMGGIALEAPMYQSMLWPPALIALGIATTLALPDTGWTKLQVASGAVAIAVVLIAGFVAPGLTLGAGWLLAVLAFAVFLFAGYKRTIGAILGLALALGASQLLQNSRGDIGLYYLSPYSWAYAANPIQDRIRTAVNTQEWLLANSTREDSILSWVGGDWVGGDRELYVVAGMQLWGENRVTLEPVITPDDAARLDTIRPTMLAMYAPSMPLVLQFWESIPQHLRPTGPQCYDFAWQPNPASSFEYTQGHACLTTLTW